MAAALESVTDWEALSMLDTGMFDTEEYGAVYVIDDERPAIIETGTGANVNRIIGALEANDIEPEVICLTHVHLDHAGGAGHLAATYPEATVYVSESGARHLIDPDRLVAGTKATVGDQWTYYDDPLPINEQRLESLTDGDQVDLGGTTLAVHEAPGHAPHQVVFEVPNRHAVFTGDAAGIFLPSTGELAETSPPPQFDLEQCLRDIDMIQSLEPETLLYTHFGPGDASGALERYRRVLTGWVETVESILEEDGDEEAVLERVNPSPGRIAVWGWEKAFAEVRLNARGALEYLDG